MKADYELYNPEDESCSAIQRKRISMILKKAEAYFVEKGLAETRMEDIAERSGISRQTLYRYYRSKEHLALNVEVMVLKKILGRFVELFTRAAQGGLQEMEQTIDQVCLSFIREHEQEIKFTAIFDAFFVKYQGPEYVQTMRNTVSSFPNPFTQLIMREQWEGNVTTELDAKITGEMLTHSLLSLSQRVLIRHEALLEEYGFEPLELIPLQMKMFIRGIICSKPEK